jgi:RNA polymerase primary sigma factor
MITSQSSLKTRAPANGSDPESQLARVQPDDILDIYLLQMAQEPLLTFEQEVELARQVESGHQAERAIEEPNCTAEERARLQAQVEDGQAARERLGRANTRLVVSIAKRYQGLGVALPDLIQNGNVGLMRAIDLYDHRTGYRFATYATWWIRQSVLRSLANQGRSIRLPVHTGDRVRRVSQVAQRLENENGRRPTPEEIALETDESPTRVRQLMRWALRPVSLEQPVGENGDSQLGYFVPDDHHHRPDELADARLLSETLNVLLSHLTAREERILRLRYGLQGGEPHTLKQIGEKLDLSRERVRQIASAALQKLRVTAHEYQLRDFLREH